MRGVFATHRHFALAYLALAPLYLAPLLATTFIPAFDLPHHLAVADALTKANQPDSPYARDFIVGLKVAPFALHFVVLRALAAIVPIGVAAKVLVGAVVLALPLVTARLLAVCGRDTFPALFAFPLAYSMPLHFGLIAFVTALPFLIWMMGEAAHEHGWIERPPQRAAALGLLSLVTFFAHLEAWAIGVAAAIASVLLGPLARRKVALVVAALAPSLLLCTLFMIRTARDPDYQAEPSFARAILHERLAELHERGVASDLWSRVRGIPIHMLRGFNDGSDVVAAWIFLALLAIAAAAGLVAWSRRRPRAPLRSSAAIGPIAVALAAYFGLPHHVRHAHSIYPRFAVVLALVLLLIIPRFSAWPARVKQSLAAFMVLLVSIQGLDLIRHYAAFGRETADFEQVLAASPSGRRSGGLVFEPESAVMNVGGIFTGFPDYYVIERAAPQSSTWLYYCMDPQLPCAMRHPDRTAPLPHFSYPAQFDAARALRDIDLFLVRGGPPLEALFGRESARVQLIDQRGSWRVFVRK